MTKFNTTATARIWVDNADPGISESDAERWNFWGNSSSLQAFLCTNPTAGIQTWERIITNGSTASLNLTLAANLSGAAYDINNITNLVGINGTSNFRTSTANGNALTLQAYDVDGASYSTFITLTAGNTPTCDIKVNTLTSSAGPTITSGSGAPTGTQPKGSLYLRTDGTGVNDRMYVATDSAGTWTAVVTVA